MGDENKSAVSPESAPPPKQIEIHQQVGSVAGGEVNAVRVGQVAGDLSVQSTINQIENKIVQGDYVDRREITVLALGDPNALDQIVKLVAERLKTRTQPGGASQLPSVPGPIAQGLGEVVQAQKEAAAQGLQVQPETLYHLGMLAVYRLDYDTGLAYFRQATTANPDGAEAWNAIAWVQQACALRDMSSQNYESAAARLLEARTAALHTDPVDPSALAQRAYVSKTLGDLARARGDSKSHDENYAEAARLFEHAAQLDPQNPSVLNGLGDVQLDLGNWDAAIDSFNRAIQLAPQYTAAHNDQAIAYEQKMRTDPLHAEQWLAKSINAWKQAYLLAPSDPSFSPDDVMRIGQHLARLQSMMPGTAPAKRRKRSGKR